MPTSFDMPKCDSDEDIEPQIGTEDTNHDQTPQTPKKSTLILKHMNHLKHMSRLKYFLPT